MRGRGRGGRGDWSSDRGRGRTPYDDRNDRYPRSRSQEGRWGRERDDRDRGDRYPDDGRRDLRDDRDRPDRDHLRGKPDARTPNPAESAPQSREVSPPPVAPSAPAFGSVPNRGSISIDGTSKLPSMPRAHSDRPPSAGHLGPDSPSMSTRAPPQGPGRQFGRRIPDSPKAMRSQTFAYGGDYPEQRRPRSSGANSDSVTGTDNRSRSNYSAEPGEIVKSENETQDSKHSAADLDEGELPQDGERPSAQTPDTKAVPSKYTRKRKRPVVGVVRFSLPPKTWKEDDSESDDDEDMADYFDMEISKTESELSKLQTPALPLKVLSRYASLSHGAMVTILNDSEGLAEMLGEPPDRIAIATAKDEELVTRPAHEEAAATEPRPKPEESTPAIVDVPEVTKTEGTTVPSVAEILATERKTEEPEQMSEEKTEQKLEQKLEQKTEPQAEPQAEQELEQEPDQEPDQEMDQEMDQEPGQELNKELNKELNQEKQQETQQETQQEPAPEQLATVVLLVPDIDKVTKEPEPEPEVDGNAQAADQERYPG